MDLPKEYDIVVAFTEKIGELDYYDLKETYQLESRDIIGTFYEDDAPLLFELTETYPELHIISRMDNGEFRNCFVAGASSYRLGDGDANPELKLALPPEVKRAVTAKINQLCRAIKSE
tara:strand:- start:63 stop:416 length:354 start_codon:yes stop_codon:yes gene_type:complete